MDYNEKNAKLYMGAVTSVEQFMSGALDEKVNAEIRKRALFGALFMAIPLWGLETIAYAIVLWGTYKKISDISGVPFRKNFVKNVLSGFILNIVITFALGCVLDFIPVLGWIGSAIVGYLSILLSGMGYVKALKIAHGNNAKLDLNFKKGVDGIRKNVDVSSSKNELDKTIGNIKRTNRFFDAVENKDAEEISNVVQEYKESRKQPKVIEDAAVVEEKAVKEPAKKSINSIKAPQKSKAEHLREHKALLDEGILTQEEFDIEKKKVLEGQIPSFDVVNQYNQ